MSYLDELITACNEAKNTQPINKYIVFDLEKVENGIPSLYIIKDLSGNPETTLDSFGVYRKKTDRKCSKINSPSTTMYVGSSIANVKKRLKEHMGFGSKHTYALNLNDWFFGEYEITVFHYDVTSLVLQLIEDDTTNELKPAFGKMGPNGK